MKDTTFPAVGLSHRFYDVISGEAEPPHLFAGGVKPGYYLSLMRGMMPMNLRYIYSPYAYHGSLTDARAGWGRLKEAIGLETTEEIERRRKLGVIDTPVEAEVAVKTLAVPWNVRQIGQLQASLFKLGWKPSATRKILWMEGDTMGKNFCDHFGVE